MPNQPAAIGTMLRFTCSSFVVLIAREAGLDFLMVDMEHGSSGFEVLSTLSVAARGARIRLFVRVPELSKGYVSRALDSGANGVMVPMVETPEQAASLVQWAKYPPLGSRGFSSIGVHTEFRKLNDVRAEMSTANEDTLVIAQIETVKGLEAVDEIAAVEGIDALLVGPNDLAVSLGCPGNLMSEEEDLAIEKIAGAAGKHGKIIGIHADVSLLKRWSHHGFGLIMQSTDAHILAAGMRSVRDSALQAVGGTF